MLLVRALDYCHFVTSINLVKQRSIRLCFVFRLTTPVVRCCYSQVQIDHTFAQSMLTASSTSHSDTHHSIVCRLPAEFNLEEAGQHTSVDKSASKDETPILRIEGFPPYCTVACIRSALSDVADSIQKIEFAYNTLGYRKDAFVEFKAGTCISSVLRSPIYFGSVVLQRQLNALTSCREEMEGRLTASGSHATYGVSDAMVRVFGFSSMRLDESDITEFFHGLTISPNGITIVPTNVPGLPVIFVKFQSIEMSAAALKLNQKPHPFTGRKIDVRPTDENEKQHVMSRFQCPQQKTKLSSQTNRTDKAGLSLSESPVKQALTEVVRLSDLPINVSEDEIRTLFDGLHIRPNGICISSVFNHQQTRTAFVRFHSSDHAALALQRHGTVIRNISVQICPVSAELLMEVLCLSSDIPQPTVLPKDTVSSSYAPNTNGYVSHAQQSPTVLMDLRLNHCLVHLKCVPSAATVKDISDFFRPLPIRTVNFVFDSKGRPCGNADVEFYNHLDALQALKRDKGYLHHARLEVYSYFS